MRLFLIIGLLALGACSSKYHELAHTSASDPVWVLNETKRPLNPNALTTPPAPVSNTALVTQ